MKLVIVGAGFAGIATAYHLARRGVREILVVEREEGPADRRAIARTAGPIPHKIASLTTLVATTEMKTKRKNSASI